MAMGKMQTRVRDMMDKGHDFTDTGRFIKNYETLYNVSIDYKSVLKYGVIYQNELEAEGDPLPWKANPATDESESFSPVPSIKTADSQGLLTDILNMVKESTNNIEVSDDVLVLLNAIEIIGIKRFRAAFVFIKTMEETVSTDADNL